MRDTRFIFVEGIMGAGKTTTAQFLTEGARSSQRGGSLRWEASWRGFSPCIPVTDMVHLF